MSFVVSEPYTFGRISQIWSRMAARSRYLSRLLAVFLSHIHDQQTERKRTRARDGERVGLCVCAFVCLLNLCLCMRTRVCIVRLFSYMYCRSSIMRHIWLPINFCEPTHLSNFSLRIEQQLSAIETISTDFRTNYPPYSKWNRILLFFIHIPFACHRNPFELNIQGNISSICFVIVYCP